MAKVCILFNNFVESVPTFIFYVLSDMGVLLAKCCVLFRCLFFGLLSAHCM